MCRTVRSSQRPFPSLFSVPGLSARPWWSAEDALGAAGLARLLEAAPAIAAEAAAARAALPDDYLRSPRESTLHEGAWEWRSLVSRGALQPAAVAACPATAATLQRLPPLLLSHVPFAYAFFSTLAPGASIAPHHGPSNIRLRVHLPLSVPPGGADAAALTVAGEARAWVEGRPLVFDDTYEHSAVNRAAVERTVLLFDVWHPELRQDEREAIAAMFGEARSAGWLA